MFNKLKECIHSFLKIHRTVAQFAFGSFNHSREFFKNLQPSSIIPNDELMCNCGDFISENTNGKLNIKKLQELVLPNTEVDLNQFICTLSQNTTLPTHAIGLGIGALLGLSYLGYQYQKYCEKNAEIKITESESISSPHPAI